MWPPVPNPQKRKRGKSYDKEKSKRVKAELLDVVYFTGNNADPSRLCSTGRLDEIAADLASSDPCEMAANQADRGSELYRSSYKNMVHSIFANEFRKAGTTSRPGARTPGGKTTRSARGFAKFLGPLTSLGVHASNIPPKNMLCMARKYGLTEEEVGIIRITRWYKSSIPESGMNVSGHDFGSLADDEKAQAAPELAQASAGAPAPISQPAQLREPVGAPAPAPLSAAAEQGGAGPGAPAHSVEEAASGASCKTSAVQMPKMTPLEVIEPEVADEVADEFDVQMREMTPLEPEVADEVADEFDKFDNQCPANPFFRVAWPSDMDQDQDWLQCLK